MQITTQEAPSIKFCTINLPHCVYWFQTLSWVDRFLVMFAVLLALFLFLRIVFWICTWFD